jgi:hypothetical protein
MLRSAISTILLPLLALVLQVLACFVVTRWSHTDPSSSSAAFMLEIGAGWLFYLLPSIGILGAILCLRHFREKPRSLVVTGFILNLGFLVGSGLWAIAGIWDL